MGATTSVLLIGEAQVPGNLVLAATNSGGAFSDVPIGTTTSRAIVLTNPGQIPSGRVTIISATIASRQTSATATEATRRGWSTARAASSTCASPHTTTCPEPPI